MATEKQIEANKRNAEKSTGPKTETGKATSAVNSLKHGITAKKFLRPGEDPAEVEAIYEALRDVHQPEDPFMEDLVLKIAMSHYRISRAFRAEAEHSPLAGMLIGDHDDRVKNLGAYSAMIRKDLKYLEQALAEHKERRAALKSASAAPIPVNGRERVGKEAPALDTSRAALSARKGNPSSEQNQKTKPISTASCEKVSDTTPHTAEVAQPVAAAEARTDAGSA